MAEITITSNNFSGYTGDITFYPYSGGSISYGSQIIPYTIETENFNGEYNIQLDYEGVEVNCGVQVGASPCVEITTDGATTDYSGLYTFIGYGYISYDSRVPDIDVICDETNPISQALYFYNNGVNTYIIGVVDDIVARITELRITKYDSSFDAECGNTYSSFSTATTLAYPTYNSTHLFPSTGNYSSGVPNQGTYLLENNPSCQIVPDVDANAYLEDVIASGGTTNSTINNAVNTLFEELKSAGLYNYMEVMYPFVGGTAASHSINATLNKTFDITWYGGLTHNISGTTGNGTNGYGDTHFNTALYFPQDDFSVGFYQTTNNTTNNGFNLGYFEGVADQPLVQLSSNYAGTYWVRAGDSGPSSTTANSGNVDGQYIVSRTSSSLARMYRNTTGVLDYTRTYVTGAGSALSMFVWAFANNGGNPFNAYSNQEMNFIFFMSKGLSASEVSTLDGIINTFQTSLGRNIY